MGIMKLNFTKIIHENYPLVVVCVNENLIIWSLKLMCSQNFKTVLSADILQVHICISYCLFSPLSSPLCIAIDYVTISQRILPRKVYGENASKFTTHEITCGQEFAYTDIWGIRV